MLQKINFLHEVLGHKTDDKMLAIPSEEKFEKKWRSLLEANSIDLFKQFHAMTNHKNLFEDQTKKLQEAIDICIEAGPTDIDNPNQAATSTYAGATGWSTATMRQTLFTLRCWNGHYDD